MSKCDLAIVLTEPDRVYRPGETVRGHVHVTVDEAVECRGLTVTEQWRTHGRGNRDKGPETRLILFQGAWQAGERLSYPFAVTVPAGPATYHGTVLNIDHYLTARADIPWSLDAKAETEFLVAGDGAQSYDFGPKHEPAERSDRTQRQVQVLGSILLLGCFGLPGLIMMVSGAAALIAWFTRGRSEAMAGFFLIPFGGIFFAVGVGVAFLLNRSALARRKMGAPVIQISPRMVSPGESVSIQLMLQPRASLTVNKATVQIRGRERAVSGAGTSRTTHTQDLHSVITNLTIPSQLEAGQPMSFSARVGVPRDAPPSFAAEDNAIEWHVIVTLDLKDWPDFEEEYLISVRP